MEPKTPDHEPSPPAQPRIYDAWYIACQSGELRDKPLPRVVLQQPLVLFRRADGSPAALQDRCPHRSVPLSYGKVAGDHIQCGYHGWELDGGGRCRKVPGLFGEPDGPSRRAPTFAVREQQGFVWIYARPDVTPIHEPYWFEHADLPGYVTVRHEVRAPASVHAVAENALDVPHTAFLHGGLFRDEATRNEIRAVVQRHHDRVEAEYIGEPRPTGLVARILSPSGGVVTHFDRFVLPSIVQVEYRIGDENHLILNGAATPVSDYDTRLYACVAVRSRIPGRLVKPLIQPLALRIFAQDAEVLALQTASIQRFGEERFASTDLDLLGPHILRLMRRAERGELGDPQAPPYRREVTMAV